jgi:hypothetical protein
MVNPFKLKGPFEADYSVDDGVMKPEGPTARELGKALAERDTRPRQRGIVAHERHSPPPRHVFTTMPPRKPHRPTVFDTFGEVGRGRRNDSEDVLSARRALAWAGYLSRDKALDRNGVDNEFFEAIERFQKSVGVKTDGWMGSRGETAKALDAAIAPKVQAYTASTAESRPKERKDLVVDDHDLMAEKPDVETPKSRQVGETKAKPSAHTQNDDTSDAREHDTGKAPVLKGTTFFGGAGMEGAYLDDMVKALEDNGIGNARTADPKKWSKGTMRDAFDILSERNRDDESSDLSSMGKKGDQFNLIGYSYGGLQAAQAAADYAEKGGKVDHLVLIGTPVSKEFLDKLKANPNIGKVEVIDLMEQGDPIRAGMGTGELISAAPKLGLDFSETYKKDHRGHFYYGGGDSNGRTRRRELARRLRKLGLQ